MAELNDSFKQCTLRLGQALVPVRVFNRTGSNSGEKLTLDVVAKHLAVALGPSLSKSLSSLAAARHDC